MTEQEMLDKIDEWHNGDSELSLPEYLGMSDSEYASWVGADCSREHREKPNG